MNMHILYHSIFRRGREGRAGDVQLDAVGGGIGVACRRFWLRNIGFCYSNVEIQNMRYVASSLSCLFQR